MVCLDDLPTGVTARLRAVRRTKKTNKTIEKPGNGSHPALRQARCAASSPAKQLLIAVALLLKPAAGVGKS
jgi:hypothetical protein